jgi:hypothetical protein
LDGAGAAHERPIFTHLEWRQITWLINPNAVEPDRWQGTADSAKYLTLVTYLVQRDRP